VKSKRVQLVVNIPLPNDPLDIKSGYLVRRAAADHGISLLTNEKCFMLFVDSLERVKGFTIKTWKEYLAMTTSSEDTLTGTPTAVPNSPIAAASCPPALNI
jgi:hypothetical protein